MPLRGRKNTEPREFSYSGVLCFLGDTCFLSRFGFILSEPNPPKKKLRERHAIEREKAYENRTFAKCKILNIRGEPLVN